jgi:hypothetical protein
MGKPIVTLTIPISDEDRYSCVCLEKKKSLSGMFIKIKDDQKVVFNNICKTNARCCQYLA